ncbi:Holo-[acyl-carrier-protein] synthase [Waddlia chondrophila 2032/99]|uniref:Holo-[acyl-carrier-protein] synthase n=2 Tax=Waddlia chondrophila TaxID=71667 RepID=D6YWN1_WADCW|nr:holo-ACP synthase [Waddlia chondrophila]ADI38542.1 Holo-[acyl-carrier-protein] synthase [Waddlia chondrophila WSU 86-1044]CCB91024.1 Holo-[acyl-carrier-protein] synthase [Waddlia chondrophila 2032/99]
MIKGLGTDIIEIDRIEKVFNRYGQKFLDRILSKSEQEYCLKYKNPVQHYAGRFAAKEAIVKALGTGIRKAVSWTDIEILNNNQGKPQVYLSPEVRSHFSDPIIHISISHSKKYATAVAIMEK